MLVRHHREKNGPIAKESEREKFDWIALQFVRLERDRGAVSLWAQQDLVAAERDPQRAFVRRTDINLRFKHG